MAVKGWQKINTWRIKGPILFIAFLLGVFEHALHWENAALAAGVAVVIPLIGFRAFWTELRFWAYVAAFACLQIPLVMAVRPLVNSSTFAGLYIFGILDCAFMVTALSYVLEKKM